MSGFDCVFPASEIRPCFCLLGDPRNWVGNWPPWVEVGWLSCNDNPLSTAEAAASGNMLIVMSMKMIDGDVDGGQPRVLPMCMCQAAAVGP